jgi:hypothetical protein
VTGSGWESDRTRVGGAGALDASAGVGSAAGRLVFTGTELVGPAVERLFVTGGGGPTSVGDSCWAYICWSRAMYGAIGGLCEN